MPFDVENSAKYEFLKPEDFRRILTGEPERSTKKSPLTQIADLYLYPMAKGGYEKDFPPFKMLMENKKLIDSILPEAKIASCGIKYSCFES